MMGSDDRCARRGAPYHAYLIRDFAALTDAEKRTFRVAVVTFLADLPTRQFRVGLRVRDVEGYPGVWEMTWGGDGAPRSAMVPPCMRARYMSFGDVLAAMLSSTILDDARLFRRNIFMVSDGVRR